VATKGMRANRATMCLAKNARHSPGALRSLAAQKRLARDDNGKVRLSPVAESFA